MRLSMLKQDVIDHFGDVKTAAKALNIKPAAIYQWGERIPMLRAYEIERITRGALKADDEPVAKPAVCFVGQS